MERAKGIEPLPETWKASILPLNYTRTFKLQEALPIFNEPFGSIFLVLGYQFGALPVKCSDGPRHLTTQSLCQFSQVGTSAKITVQPSDLTNVPQHLE
jgi:hypothetical protein